MATNQQRVGKLIRELRQHQKINGTELGRRVGMSQSKISKLETGLYPHPLFKEIERILNILNAPYDVRQRIYQLLGNSRPEEFSFRPYGVHYTSTSYNREQKAKYIRVFSPFVVPALLQTNDYRLALLKSWGAVEHDMEIIKAIAKRQELLWDEHRKFHFIMHQALLYGGPAGQKGLGLAQIDRIERFMNLPNIKIGLIPLESGMPLVEFGPFALVDDRLVSTATVDGDLHSTNSKGIALYERLFTDLSHLALYDNDARRLIRLAIEFFGDAK